MYKKLMVIAALLFSVKIWALSCSLPTTISDPDLDGFYPKVCVNDKGETVVIWWSEKDEKEAISLAYKTQNNGWSSPELLSPWEAYIYSDYTCFINANGDVAAAWGFDDSEENIKITMVEKKAGTNWTAPLNCFDLPGFVYSQLRFDTQGQLLCLGTRAKPSEFDYKNMTLRPGNNELILSTLSSATEENWDILKLPDYNYTKDLVLELNNSGGIYAFEVETGNSYKIFKRKIENEKFASAQQIDHPNANDFFQDIKVSLNEKGTAAIGYRDKEKNRNVIIMHESSYTTPFILSSREENPDIDTLVAIDEQENVLAACVIELEGELLIKTAYKPVDHEWTTPILFTSPKGTYWNPEIKSDNNGNFVMVWLQEVRNRNAVIGATFSTATETWSEPTLLSPTGIHCYDFAFSFWAPGKGYISWVTSPTGFETNIQVAELCN